MTAYNKYEEYELLSLLSQDDKVAFTELYNRFWQKLFVIAYNRIRDEQSAEDIVHDVFTSLWTNRHKISIESLENYLAVAVKYAVFTKVKKQARDRQYRKETQLAPIVNMPVEEGLHYKQILEIVKTEVEKLPERCQLIFKYSREEGMPVKQIAQDLNISSKTVENQLTKALRQIRLATRSLLQSFLP